jgi:hypothetical protein
MYRPLRSLLLGAVLLGFASLSSCSKDEASPTATPAQLLLGRWLLTTSTNGMTGHATPADPAQRRELVFTAPGQMTALLNGTILSTKSYSLVQQQSALTQKPETYLVTASGAMQLPQTVRVDATTLTLSFDVYDGPSATYHR